MPAVRIILIQMLAFISEGEDLAQTLHLTWLLGRSSSSLYSPVGSWHLSVHTQIKHPPISDFPEDLSCL